MHRTVTQPINRTFAPGETFTSQAVASRAEQLSVTLAGRADAPVTAAVLSHSATGTTAPVFTCRVMPDDAGRITFTCRFDPVHLAVYQDAVSFTVTAVSEAPFALTTLTAEEEENPAAGVAACSRAEKWEDGTAVVPIRQKDGTEIFVSTQPQKVLLMGNSLLLGLFCRYGMCASSPRPDHAHYLETALRVRCPALTVTRLHGAGFECLEDPALFDKWFTEDPNPASGSPTADAFTADTDLIVIQLGDNVNTEAKKQTFPQTAPRLLEKIRTLCPRARVVWVYGWYNKMYTHDALMSLCAQERIEWLDISGLRGADNEAVSGQVLENPSGGTVVADDRWITHPGDRGMQRIAEAILGVLSLPAV